MMFHKILSGFISNILKCGTNLIEVVLWFADEDEAEKATDSLRALL